MEHNIQTLLAICKKAGLDTIADSIRSMHAGGISNAIYSINNTHVLRIAHNTPDGISDALTKSVASPAAYAANIRCPELVAFDNSGEIVDTPYTIYQLVPGMSLADYGKTVQSIDELSQIYRDIGSELAILHTQVTECPDPNNYLDTPDYPEVSELIPTMYEQGYIGDLATNWLTERFRRIEHALSGREPERVFLHGDAHTGNIMVNNGQFAAMIDWGDAGWGDPAVDFIGLPTRAIPAALESYRQVRKTDESIELRILHYHLLSSLYYIKREPQPYKYNWAATPASRVFELLAATTSSPLQSWVSVLS